MSIVRNAIMKMLSEAVLKLPGATEQADSLPLSIELDIPKIPEHGDYASNVALALTRRIRQKPRQIAEAVIANLNDSEGLLRKVEIAGPGFINFFLQADAWYVILKKIMTDPESYGRLDIGRGRKVQVEFVSANPTGPLHIGHGRGAATGDVLANILEVCGYDVDREYYINDAGNQMNTLGRSLYYRYQELLGEAIEFPDAHYRGDYMRDLARDFINEVGNRYLRAQMEDVVAVFTRYASDKIMDGIKEDLRSFGVSFGTSSASVPSTNRTPSGTPSMTSAGMISSMRMKVRSGSEALLSVMKRTGLSFVPTE